MKKKSFVESLRNMREMDEMEEDEKDTVRVSCLSGIAIGVAVTLIPSALCAALIIYAIMTQ